MDFLSIKLFPSNLVEAIGSTLVHSLWQGVLMAIVTGLIIIFTRTSSPAIRYNLLIGTLVLFVAGVTTTFVLVYNSSAVQTPSHEQTIIAFRPVSPEIRLKHEQLAPFQPTFKYMTMSFINKNANRIVLIWFVIVCARALQLASGLNGLYYLRRKSVYAINGQWEDRVKELAAKLGISQIVSIAQSGIAKVPMVIGHLKPLILIPVGLITTLTPEEVEAILIHELAHIRRKDYLVNMLQSLLEIIFFFNPAILWISALIKTERENCCDDIVVAQSSSKANYIKALVSCQEHHSASPVYSVALTGNKNHLLTRVKRMLYNNNQSLNMMEKSLLAVGLVSAGLLTAAFSNTDKINKLVTNTAKAVEHIAVNINKKGTVPKLPATQPITLPVKENTLASKIDTPKIAKLKVYSPKEVSEHTSISVKNSTFITYLYKQDGVLYQLNYKDKVLNSMQVNGKNIPDANMDSYQSIINKVLIKNNVEHDERHVPGNTRPTTAATENTLTPTQIQQEMEALIKQKVESLRKKSADFDQFIAYGDDYRKNGQYQDALDFYRKAEKLDDLNADLEKKITDTKRTLEANLTPQEKLAIQFAKSKADADARHQEQVDSFIARGDHYMTKQRYQDAMDSYQKAEMISPINADLAQKISYAQKQLDQFVADSVNKAYKNSSYNASPTPPQPAKTYAKAPTPPYTTNYGYTAAGKSEQSRKDSINRANIIGDMQKDGLIKSTDNLSFKIGTKEFVVNGNKQPDDIYQRYRAKYVKVVGHGDWSWYYNYDTSKESQGETAAGGGKNK